MPGSAGMPRSSASASVAGGGTLVGDFLLRYPNLTVLDVAGVAAGATRRCLGKHTQRVNCIATDVAPAELPQTVFDLWRHRAVFPFSDGCGRQGGLCGGCVHAGETGGHSALATFGESGPEQCSGSPVMRYRPDKAYAEFGDAFTLL